MDGATVGRGREETEESAAPFIVHGVNATPTGVTRGSEDFKDFRTRQPFQDSTARWRFSARGDGVRARAAELGVRAGEPRGGIPGGGVRGVRRGAPHDQAMVRGLCVLRHWKACWFERECILPCPHLAAATPAAASTAAASTAAAAAAALPVAAAALTAAASASAAFSVLTNGAAVMCDVRRHRTDSAPSSGAHGGEGAGGSAASSAPGGAAGVDAVLEQVRLRLQARTRADGVIVTRHLPTLLLFTSALTHWFVPLLL